MGRYRFILIFLGLIGLIAAVVPKQKEFSIAVITDVPKDSISLVKDSLFICKGHYFEWCNDPSTCAYDNEVLEKVSLWEYYKLLECEECQKFFEDNYYKFIQTQPEL